MANVVRIKITLRDSDPVIWRRIEVPSSMTLMRLHAVIQAAMGWKNCHLYQFMIGRQTIDGPGFVADISDSRNLKANRIVLDELVARKAKRFDYLYDIGDSWEHDLRIEKEFEADPAVTYPRFLDGAGACPPEDVGGIPGFYNFVEAISDPRHPEHEDFLEWYGGAFDASALDTAQVHRRVARLATRKRA